MVESLFYELAFPADPELERFDCGEEEVNAYFRNLCWFNSEKNRHAPPTYVFRTVEGGPVVGYASVGFANANHPTDGSVLRAKYLRIYVVGVNVEYQRCKNPNESNCTFAHSILRILEKEKNYFAASKKDCLGLCLWVRSNNTHAINFYKKVGFEEEPSGPTQRNGGAPHLTMRKPLKH